MGQKRDLRFRETHARRDDENRKRKVELARGLMFKHGFVVNAKRVESFLQPTSLVPTLVSESAQ